MLISFDGEFSQDDLRATLDALGNDIFFVQIGAMDGVRFDPIHSHVEKNKWRGLLVEPIPDLFEQLKMNYASCEGLIFANLAIADYEGTVEMTRINPEAVKSGVFKDVVTGISTLMPERGIIDNINLSDEVRQQFAIHKQKIEVPCCRLPVLLAKNRIERIDLLVIDTEGADWMVARQVPLVTLKPRVIYLEYEHLSSYEQIACSQHFRNHGYRIFIDKDGAKNFLAILKN